jgi:hypothetical protein
LSWTRLDDGWTDRHEFDGLPFDARWHYLALIQWCCRTARWDGTVRARDARRCSDVDEPADVLAALITAGLLVGEGTDYRIVHIDDHIPPPHLRDEKRKSDQRERQQRARAHRIGRHDWCLDTASCRASVTGDVTRDPGTGRDGPGREELQALEVPSDNGWPDVIYPPGHVEARCSDCGWAKDSDGHAANCAAA